jgi:hypothetical protein
MSVRAQRDKLQRSTAVWRIRSGYLSLGGVLVLIADLCLANHQPDTAEIDVVLVDDVEISDAMNDAYIPIVEMLGDIEQVNNVRYYSNLSEMSRAAVSQGWDQRIWPAGITDVDAAQQYPSTGYSQQHFLTHGQTIKIAFTATVTNKAMKFIRDLPASSVVTVHLKNTGDNPEISDANVEAWSSFFRGYEADTSISFVLIGSDPIVNLFRKRVNIELIAEHQFSLSEQLAVIQESNLFLGMASGPSMAAIFSEVPYAIFKNPEHDRSQMEIELGSSDTLAFAGQNQKILRQLDSTENISGAFEQLLQIGKN